MEVFMQFNKLQVIKNEQDKTRNKQHQKCSISVSLAYSIGKKENLLSKLKNCKIKFSVPFLAGEMVESMGFPTIMRLLGFCNFIYGPILLFITIRQNLNVSYIKTL